MSQFERKESSNAKLKFYIFRNTSNPKVCCLVEAPSLEEAKARVQQHASAYRELTTHHRKTC
jgi:thioester reductase-like protein